MPIPGCTRSWDHEYVLACLIDDDHVNENDDYDLEKNDVLVQSSTIDRNRKIPVEHKVGLVIHTHRIRVVNTPRHTTEHCV